MSCVEIQVDLIFYDFQPHNDQWQNTRLTAHVGITVLSSVTV